MKPRDIMTKNVKFVNTNDNVSSAAKIMESMNVGAVPVCEGKRPVGMLTDRDIVLKSIAQGKDFNNTNVCEIMSNRVIYGTPDMDVHEAAHLMAKFQIRRLPVVENNNIVGIVSIGDLATQNILVDDAGEALSSISEKTPNAGIY